MSQGDSYVQPFEVGQPIVSHIVAQVTASRSGWVPRRRYCYWYVALEKI